MENNLGYLFGLIMVKAATESEAQIVALYLIISPTPMEIYVFQFLMSLINPTFQNMYPINWWGK